MRYNELAVFHRERLLRAAWIETERGRKRWKPGPKPIPYEDTQWHLRVITGAGALLLGVAFLGLLVLFLLRV
jgi:hypothetical protein